MSETMYCGDALIEERYLYNFTEEEKAAFGRHIQFLKTFWYNELIQYR